MGLAPVAGWVKRQYYGDTNVFFIHDLSTNHLDPMAMGLFEAAIAENNLDLYIPNLVGMDVMSRIGERDASVPPYQTRRLARVAQEAGVNCTFTEIKGKVSPSQIRRLLRIRRCSSGKVSNNKEYGGARFEPDSLDLIRSPNKEVVL